MSTLKTIADDIEQAAEMLHTATEVALSEGLFEEEEAIGDRTMTLRLRDHARTLRELEGK